MLLVIGSAVMLSLYGQTCSAAAVVCDHYQSRCDNRCYSPPSQKCLSGGVVCGAHQHRCGDQCYDPSLNRCHGGGVACEFHQSMWSPVLHSFITKMLQWFVGSIRKDVGINVTILQHIDAIVE